MRAMSEAVQSRLTVISGSRDDVFYRHYEAVANQDTIRRAYEVLTRTRPTLAFSSRARVDTPTFHQDLEAILHALGSVGITRAVAVDLTREELGIPVVKVVVPGLEGHRHAVTYRPGARATAAAGKRPA
jgi:ribosomal protein S12 methylthiotransferase accessory factor